MEQIAICVYITPSQKDWINSRPHKSVSISKLIRDFLDSTMAKENEQHVHTE